MARTKTYIDDIAERVAEKNKLVVVDDDAYMDAIVQALAELTSKQAHVVNLIDKGIVKRE